MHTILISGVCALLLTITQVFGAQDPTDGAAQIRSPEDAARVYGEECVVRLRTTSQAQLDAVLQLASDVWSERIGIGVLEVQISRDKLGELDAIGVPHDMLIDDLRAHTEREWRGMIDIRQAQARDLPVGFQRGAGVHDDAWFATYRTLDEIQTYTQNIANTRPDLASISVIGQSWEGRDMHAITITAPDMPGNPASERPAVFIFSTVHAREWITPMTTCYIASKLVADYDQNTRVRDLLMHSRAIIVPVGNPDGYQYTWNSARYWRKNRRNNSDGNYGVDINRNWGYEWGGPGSSPSTSSETYRGTHPFSEPETQALRDLALSFDDKLVAMIDYHSSTQLILWPFGYQPGVVTPQPARAVLSTLAEEMAETIFNTQQARYNPIQSVDLYPASGASCDWFLGDRNVISFAMELRPADLDFSPPPATILPCGVENYAAYLTMLERSISPMTLWASPLEGDSPVTSPTVTAFASSGLDLVLPDQVTVHSRLLGTSSYNSQQMSPDASDAFITQLPRMRCGQTVEYYFSASDDDLGTCRFPRSELTPPLSVTHTLSLTMYQDDMESDTGWSSSYPTDTATEGHWVRADPEMTDAQPGDDHTPSGTICWVTDARGGGPDDHDVDGGFATLITPPFSAGPGESFAFWAYFTSTIPSFDRLELRISNDDGDTWAFIGNIPSTFGEWSRFQLDIDRYVEPTDQMRVFFRVFDISSDHTVEAAIDDFEVLKIGCPENPADLDADGALTFIDVSSFLSGFLDQEPISDFDNNGVWNFFDVAAFLVAYNAG